VMGAFFARCKIENPAERDKSAVVARILVDTGSEYTWIPTTILERIAIQREDKQLSFVMANGQTIARGVGFAIIRLHKFFTIDEVVFAEKRDLSLLGARTLEGLKLTVDPRRQKLIAAGPLPAAAGINRDNLRTGAGKTKGREFFFSRPSPHHSALI
jgi:predicted aspartyl protease